MDSSTAEVGFDPTLTSYKSLEERKAPKEKTTPLGARVPVSVKKALDDVAVLWRMHAEARGEEDFSYIDQSYVVRRLLRSGIDGAFQAYGGKPTDDEGWQVIADAIAKNVKPSSP